jgi:feruloyl esterase
MRAMIRLSTVALLAGSCWALVHAGDAADHAACQSLGSGGLFRDTTVESVKDVPADAATSIAAHCEVTATITPASGSHIGVVYRLPQNWNGKLLGLGGGGWAGNTRIDAAAPGLARGYATAQTNAGHDGTDVWDTSWAARADAVTDFSFRAIHLMTTVGKMVVAKYYRRPQSRAYFQGCSTGGRQGLMEVQRFPGDYNGVIAGAPVYSLVTQTSALLRNLAFAAPGAGLSTALLARLNEAALAACDAQDGLQDGIVTDPRRCSFDPAALLCREGAASTDCLSDSQVKAVRAVYDGVKTSAGYIAAYPLSRGSEAGWSRFVAVAPDAGAKPGSGAPGAGLANLRAALLGDPDFDLAAFNVDRDFATVRASAFARSYEASDPDIAAFVRGGGKLILWHGFDDPGPSPLATIDYFEGVQRTTGPKVKALAANVRLFIAPGVYHCRGGPGADQFDMLATLDQWVESGHAPDTIRASRADGRLSRPLCAYPTLPRYQGAGDPNDAASFHCK